MKTFDVLAAFTITAAVALGSGAVLAEPQERKPNIVVIMTDRLAAEGMRFVNYYGQASCTAGRASFITGRIPIRDVALGGVGARGS